MQVNTYIQKKFPNLQLQPGLFYNWNIGIRFKLGVNYNGIEVYENCPYLKGTYTRAITLFESSHNKNDNIYIVVDVHDFADGNTFKHKLNIFSKYVKEKSILYKLQQHTIPYLFPEDDENGIYKTHRFTLKCKPTDFKYISMLKAICNQDMGLKPKIVHDVYIINTNKNTIFHVYDDRGCDVLSTSSKNIKDMYKKYNHWILDYDRNEIDKVFN